MLPLENPDGGFVIEITAVYFEKHVEHISTLSGEMKFVHVKAGGIYNYPCDLNNQIQIVVVSSCNNIFQYGCLSHKYKW
jgi:hypothetical protein